MKYHTAIGMAMKTRERQIEPMPMAVAEVGSLLPFTLMSAPGTKLTKADVAPKKHMKSPGHPHRTTDAMVAIKPVFLLFIIFSSDKIEFMPRFFKNGKWNLCARCYPEPGCPE